MGVGIVVREKEKNNNNQQPSSSINGNLSQASCSHKFDLQQESELIRLEFNVTAATQNWNRIEANVYSFCLLCGVLAAAAPSSPSSQVKVHVAYAALIGKHMGQRHKTIENA